MSMYDFYSRQMGPDYYNPAEFLQHLIGTGPDASLNLFKIDITPQGKDNPFAKIAMRTTQFVTPKRDTVTTQIPYQNTTITIPTSGTQIDKSMMLTIRVDEQMNTMSLLRDYQLLTDTLGNYKKDDSKKLEITVTALDSTFKLNGVYSWKFHNCYIISISPLTYDYNSSNMGNINVTFIYSYFDEGK